MLHRAALLCLTLLALLCIPGCDDADASNIKIKLNADFSGSIRATRLVIPEQPSQSLTATGGVSWTAAAQVVSAAGTFTSLNDVRVEDLTFAGERTSKGLRILRVTLPRGPGAKWIGAMTAPNKDRRRETNTALNPDQKASRLGSGIAISIELPANPVSVGVSPQASGIVSTAEKNLVTLTVSVDAASKAGDDIFWDITWTEKN